LISCNSIIKLPPVLHSLTELCNSAQQQQKLFQACSLMGSSYTLKPQALPGAGFYKPYRLNGLMPRHRRLFLIHSNAFISTASRNQRKEWNCDSRNSIIKLPPVASGCKPATTQPGAPPREQMQYRHSQPAGLEQHYRLKNKTPGADRG
jgi:hypothetical protein